MKYRVIYKPKPTQSRVKLKIARIAAIIIAAIGVLIAVWNFSPLAPWLPGHKSTSSALSQAEVDAFVESHVQPALIAYMSRNNKAVDQAVERISRGIDDYKNGIEPFVEDITSWGTRFGIIHRMGSDLGEKWWGDPANATAVHSYIEEKYELHLFSDTKLNTLVTTTLNQFHDDLIASQNRLHADVKTAWKKSGHARYKLDIDKILQEVNVSVHDISESIATDSVTIGVISFVVGLTVEETVSALVKCIIARVTTYITASAATTTAASGGATAATTTAGGGGGSALGPIGTAIGAGVGLVVGIIADWWMTNELEKKLTVECDQMIDDVKSLIILGTTETPGLESAFSGSINLMRIAEEDGIRKAIQGIAR